MIGTLYTLYQQSSGITTDSRQVPAGAVFFALKGEQYDGNRFASHALEQGANLSVVDDPAVALDSRYFLVGDVLQTLQELARHHRKQIQIPVIGITGSNGKTTTKELIHQVLSTRFKTSSTPGNLNNHIGVPVTLLSLRPTSEIAVVEMGANHAGEIASLCTLARPDFGLITNIGRAHLEGFGSLEGVVRAKTELYTFLKVNGGKIFINADDPLLMSHAAGIPQITYGFSPGCSIHGKAGSAAGCLEMELEFPDQPAQQVRTHLFGSVNASNILAAACVGNYFKIPASDIKNALETYTPSNNRSQVRQTSRNLLILDAYNANPSSMEPVLKDFDRTFPSDKIVILGDMLELGPETEPEHRRILEMLTTLTLQRIFLVGPVFSALNTHPEWQTFQTSLEAKEWFADHPIGPANILLKASHDIHLEEIAEIL